MTQSDIINNNFSKAFECIKCSNAYDTGEVLSEEKLFKQISERKRSTFDLSKFTVVGSPTITDDGVASGFSDSDYLKIPNTQLQNSNNWEIKLKFTTGEIKKQYLMSADKNDVGFALGIWSENNITGYLFCWLPPSIHYNVPLSVLKISANTTYYVKYAVKNGIFTIDVSYDDITYKTCITETLPSSLISSPQVIGVGNNADRNFVGSIDLKQFSITVDGKEVFSGNKTGIDNIKPDNYEVVGSPVISNDGVASGFSISPLNRIAQSFDISAKENITIECGVIYKDDMEGPIFASNNSTRLFVSSQTINLWTDIATNVIPVTNYLTSMNVSNGDLLKVKLILTNNTAQVIVSVKNQTFATNITTSNIPLNITFIHLGSNDAGVFTSSIDLNSFKIYVDGNLVYQPCLKIPYTQSKTG